MSVILSALQVTAAAAPSGGSGCLLVEELQPAAARGTSPHPCRCLVLLMSASPCDHPPPAPLVPKMKRGP
ncbi:hypothetical protein HNP84_003700 [Thermocatellispora tengchongensis]|uniref:Uncharacterized protein n=1 Tax=Thermocatellispora tengchongensis TaxID=1073253 RepID=A0A840NYK3_9ACTN|nr:hypothetical protein [Thermocatellispora tengchongensis]